MTEHSLEKAWSVMHLWYETEPQAYIPKDDGMKQSDRSDMGGSTVFEWIRRK